MIDKKELQDNQRVYINSLEKRLNEAISPAGGGQGVDIRKSVFHSIANSKSM
jgi:hypothetical protein